MTKLYFKFSGTYSQDNVEPAQRPNTPVDCLIAYCAYHEDVIKDSETWEKDDLLEHLENIMLKCTNGVSDVHSVTFVRHLAAMYI